MNEPRPIDFSAEPQPDALAVDLRVLLATRCLIQGGTGAGKSYALRGVLEALHGRVWQLVVDPEGEYHTLRSSFPYVLLAPDGDLDPDPERADEVVRALMEAGASAVLDLSEYRKARGQDVAAAFLDAVMRQARKVPGRVLVAVDEAHRIAPQEGADRASTRALSDVAARGRKRGVGLLVATQRLAKLDKDVAAECASVLVGRTTLGLDLKKAAEALQFSTRERAKLRALAPGQFFAVGPAFADEPTVVQTLPVQTPHPEPGDVVPHTPAADQDLARLIAALRQPPTDEPEDGADGVDSPPGRGDRVQYWHDQAEAQRRRADRAEEAQSAAVEARDQAAIERDRARAEAEQLAAVLAGIEAAAREGRGGAAAPRPPDEVEQKATTVAASTNGAATAQRPATTAHEVERPDVEGLEFKEGLELKDGHRRVLAAVAQLDALGTPHVDRGTVALLSDYTEGGGAFNRTVTALSRAGLVEAYDGVVELTDEGRGAVGEVTPATLADVHEGFRRLARKHVGTTGVEILETIIEAHPRPVSKTRLGEIHDLATTGGAFSRYLAGLRRIGAIDYKSGGGGGGSRVVADARLFPEALA